MPGRLAPWTQRMVAALSENDELPWELVIDHGMLAVPPERAFREAERRRGYHVATAKAQGRSTIRLSGERVKGDTDAVIRVGARVLADNGLRSLVRSGAVVRFLKDGEPWVRLARRPWEPPAS